MTFRNKGSRPNGAPTASTVFRQNSSTGDKSAAVTAYHSRDRIDVLSWPICRRGFDIPCWLYRQPWSGGICAKEAESARRLKIGAPHFPQIAKPCLPQTFKQLTLADFGVPHSLDDYDTIAYRLGSSSVYDFFDRLIAADQDVEHLVDDHDRRDDQHCMQQRNIRIEHRVADSRP